MASTDPIPVEKHSHLSPPDDTPFSTHYSSKSHTSSPLPFLNPTRARFHHAAGSSPSTSPHAQPATDPTTTTTTGSSSSGPTPPPVYTLLWRSRDNRKGRHALLIPASASTPSAALHPPPTSTARETLRGIARMFTTFPVHDISYDVALIFTLGSIVWVINSFFVYLPLAQPSSAFPGESVTGGGVTAFIGATIFVLGSWFLIIEAVNENRSACFGWAVHKALDDGRAYLHHDLDSCSHHHANGGNLVGRGTAHSSSSAASAPPLPSHSPPSSGAASSSSQERDGGEKGKGEDVDVAEGKSGPEVPEAERKFQWYPSLRRIRTHYIRELGFLACAFQLAGATIFWIAGFTALPGMVPSLPSGEPNQKLLDGVYWTPQVVGGCGFIISGTLFMLETQQRWWKPAFGVLGWHIGAWNLLGGIGFTLCGALGYWTGSREVYEGCLATFWGSWAFLIGSVIQLFESLQKWPVEREGE